VHQAAGLWIRDVEKERIARYPIFEGLPDLDVSKVAKCMPQCRGFGVALDIGAHVGATAVFLARHFERVVAIEAIPETYEVLLENAKGRSIEPLNAAVSDAPGIVSFEYHARFSHLSHVCAPEKTLGKSTTVSGIPMLTVDSLGLRPQFIKVDVEGMEGAVIRGARETIVANRPVIMIEQGGNEEKYFGYPRDEATSELLMLGMVDITPPRWKIDRLFVFPDRP
jgi:FkbM family methyltransferase